MNKNILLALIVAVATVAGSAQAVCTKCKVKTPAKPAAKVVRR